MQPGVYFEDFRAFVEDILGRPTALGDWLTERAAKKEMFGCGIKDFRRVVSNVLFAHFTMEDDPSDAEPIGTDTIRGIEAEFLEPESASLDDIVGRLALATPKSYLCAKSMRRTQFLFSKTDLRKYADHPAHTETVYELLYLAIAIMEDREHRGMSLPM